MIGNNDFNNVYNDTYYQVDDKVRRISLNR